MKKGLFSTNSPIKLKTRLTLQAQTKIVINKWRRADLVYSGTEFYTCVFLLSGWSFLWPPGISYSADQVEPIAAKPPPLLPPGWCTYFQSAYVCRCVCVRCCVLFVILVAAPGGITLCCKEEKQSWCFMINTPFLPPTKYTQANTQLGHMQVGFLFELTFMTFAQAKFICFAQDFPKDSFPSNTLILKEP